MFVLTIQMIVLTDLQLTGKLDSAVFSKDLQTFLWLSSNLVSLTKKAWVLRLMVLWQISLTDAQILDVLVYETLSLPNRAFGLFFVTHPTDSKHSGVFSSFLIPVCPGKTESCEHLYHTVLSTVYTTIWPPQNPVRHILLSPFSRWGSQGTGKLPTLPRVTPLVRGVGASGQGMWLQISCSWLHVISCLTLADRWMISTLRIAFLWSAFFHFAVLFLGLSESFISLRGENWNSWHFSKSLNLLILKLRWLDTQ